jgi:hypothetical protein
MTQHDDWKQCNELYCDWMGYEAVESGYDFKAAWAAKEPYLKAFMEYHKKYGEMFNPEREPREAA